MMRPFSLAFWPEILPQMPISQHVLLLGSSQGHHRHGKCFHAPRFVDYR
jgi:hypothetical protein